MTAAAELRFSMLDPSASTAKPFQLLPTASTLGLTAGDVEDVEDRVRALAAEEAYRSGKLEVRSYAEYRKRRLAKRS